MKNLRGNHTSLTPLSRKIVQALQKVSQNLEISPGFIKAGIKAKTRNVTFKKEKSDVIDMTVVSLSSKQTLRVYNTEIPQLQNTLRELGIKFKEVKI